MCGGSGNETRNGKRSFKSARESLLNLFDFFENVMLRVQYPREYPAFSRLNHCGRFSHYRASLAEEEEAERSCKVNGGNFGHLLGNDVRCRVRSIVHRVHLHVASSVAARLKHVEAVLQR